MPAFHLRMFGKLIGNDNIKEILKRLIKSGRVPSSLLFTGADGVGKKQFALEIAKTFICQNLQNFEACGDCLNCKRADKFNFPKDDDRDAFKQVIFSEHSDIGTVVPYKTGILVDAIRDLEREANFRPFQAKARFFIIDDADKMNDSASNALLKTLEEPPETSYIFLITSRPDALLPTILSRCQNLRFAPIDKQNIENFLLETKKYSPDDAELLANLSGGSIGQALETDLEKFRDGRASMLKVLESLLLKENRAQLLQIAEQLNDAKAKDEYENKLDILQTLIHDIWTIRLGKSEQNLTNADLIFSLKKLAENADAKNLAKWLGEIETLREQLVLNLNRKIAADALFVQMAG